MKKRLLSILLVMILVFSLVACNDDPKKEINLETKVESEDEQKQEASTLDETNVEKEEKNTENKTGDAQQKIEQPVIEQVKDTVSKITSCYVTKDVLEKSAAYVYSKVQNPIIASIGGEWAIIGLKQSGYAVASSYYEKYYDTCCETVKSCNGVLHEKKYTDYSRASLALSLIGKDPADVNGFNLIKPLNNFDQTIWQGNNGAIWALIAIDANNTACAQREAYIKEILRVQRANGSWGISDSMEDIDLTAMALTALSTYSNRDNVRAAINKGFAYLEEQYKNGAMIYSENLAQCLVAYSSNNKELPKGMYEAFISYRLSDGSFEHKKSGGANQMASEQGLYALSALYRAENGMSKVFVVD